MARLPDEMKRACKVLGISQSQVMAYTVYEDRVVLIEGPVGFKRIVTFGVMADFEAKERTEAATGKEAKRGAKPKVRREK